MKYYSDFLPYTFLSVILVGLYFVLESKLTKPWMRWVWWIGSLVIVVAVGWRVGTDHIWADFGNGYYYAGRKILQNPAQLYYGENCGGYVNFPLLAYIFTPFGLMTKGEAGRIFFLINIVSILPLAYWLVKFGDLKGWRRWFLLFFLLISGPLDYSIWLGNSTNLIMLSMVLALEWFKKGKDLGTGILLGINGLVKIPMIIPAGYFFVRRQWMVVIGGVLTVGFVIVLSFGFIPFSLNRMWLNNCILSFSGKPVAAYNNQSVAGVLARELIPGSRIDYWLPLDPTPLFATVSGITVLLLYVPVLIVLLYGWRSARTKSGYLLEFFLVLICSLLTSPISWTHYFMFLLIPVAFYLDENLFTTGTKGLNLLLLVSLILVTLPVDLTLAFFTAFGQRVALSLHFGGGVLFYIFLFALWMRHRNSILAK
jgi:hypothetical protein